MTDRLAPDTVNANVSNTVTTSSLTAGDGEITATDRDGRVALDTADTDVRRLLEDILILLSKIDENTRR